MGYLKKSEHWYPTSKLKVDNVPQGIFKEKGQFKDRVPLDASLNMFACVEVSWPSESDHRVQTLVFLISIACGFESPVVTLVCLSKTLNHCFVLRMGRKAVGPVCCVTHIKELTYRKEKGFTPVPG